MAYVALSRVQGNVVLAGTVAQVTPDRLDKVFRAPAGTYSINGTEVDDAGGKVGDLVEGFPPSAVNDGLLRRIVGLVRNEPGDALTNRTFVIRAAIKAAKAAGVSKAAFLANVGNAWDTYSD